MQVYGTDRRADGDADHVVCEVYNGSSSPSVAELKMNNSLQQASVA